MEYDRALHQEAALLAGYLLGRAPGERVIALYADAMEKLAIAPVGRDERLLRFVLENPSTVGLVDAGTALLMPGSTFRRKLLVMFAILECMPEYSDLFLPRPHALLDVIRVLWSGCRGAVKGVIGAMIVAAIR